MFRFIPGFIQCHTEFQRTILEFCKTFFEYNRFIRKLNVLGKKTLLGKPVHYNFSSFYVLNYILKYIWVVKKHPECETHSWLSMTPLLACEMESHLGFAEHKPASALEGAATRTGSCARLHSFFDSYYQINSLLKIVVSP